MPERLVLCGGAKRAGEQSTLQLALDGRAQNVMLKLEDISKRLVANVPDLLIDLVEIAAYIYCADQATSRGGEVQAGMGSDWRRRFRFVIPVRQPDHWNSPQVLGSLCDTMSFLSEDDYAFEFEKATNPTGVNNYLETKSGLGALQSRRSRPVFGWTSIRSAASSRSFRPGKKASRWLATGPRPRYSNIRSSSSRSLSESSRSVLCMFRCLSPDGSRFRFTNIPRDRDPFSTRRLLVLSLSYSETRAFAFSRMASSVSICQLLNRLWEPAQRAPLTRWSWSFFAYFSAPRSAGRSTLKTRLSGKRRRRLSDQLSITAAGLSSNTQ